MAKTATTKRQEALERIYQKYRKRELPTNILINVRNILRKLSLNEKLALNIPATWEGFR